MRFGKIDDRGNDPRPVRTNGRRASIQRQDRRHPYKSERKGFMKKSSGFCRPLRRHACGPSQTSTSQTPRSCRTSMIAATPSAGWVLHDEYGRQDGRPVGYARRHQPDEARLAQFLREIHRRGPKRLSIAPTISFASARRATAHGNIHADGELLLIAGQRPISATKLRCYVTRNLPDRLPGRRDEPDNSHHPDESISRD